MSIILFCHQNDGTPYVVKSSLDRSSLFSCAPISYVRARLNNQAHLEKSLLERSPYLSLIAQPPLLCAYSCYEDVFVLSGRKSYQHFHDVRRRPFYLLGQYVSRSHLFL